MVASTLTASFQIFRQAVAYFRVTEIGHVGTEGCIHDLQELSKGIAYIHEDKGAG